MASNDRTPVNNDAVSRAKRPAPPELYQIVIECRDEAQQRELYERLRQEGVKVRVMVL